MGVWVQVRGGLVRVRGSLGGGLEGFRSGSGAVPGLAGSSLTCPGFFNTLVMSELILEIRVEIKA